LKLTEEIWKLAVQGGASEEWVVDDVPQVHQPFPQEEVEGVGLVLSDDLQMRTQAAAHEIPVLEVEEDGQEEEGNEVQEDQSSEGVPEKLPDMFLARGDLGARAGRGRLDGHGALVSKGSAGGAERREIRLGSARTRPIVG
jgi:hypothetical protein